MRVGQHLRAATYAAIVLSVLTVLWLNLRLQNHARRLVAEQRRLMSYIGPSEGTHLPPFDGTDLTGRAMTVDYARENRDSLLFVFSPYCGYTNDNWNNWDRVLRQLRPGTSVRFIDVSNQMTHEYAVRHGLQATQVVTNISADTRLRHNLIITPMTVLLGPHGAVRKVWVGALSEQSVASILEGMHVH